MPSLSVAEACCVSQIRALDQWIFTICWPWIKCAYHLKLHAEHRTSCYVKPAFLREEGFWSFWVIQTCKIKVGAHRNSPVAIGVETVSLGWFGDVIFLPWRLKLSDLKTGVISVTWIFIAIIHTTRGKWGIVQGSVWPLQKSSTVLGERTGKCVIYSQFPAHSDLEYFQPVKPSLLSHIQNITAEAAWHFNIFSVDSNNGSHHLFLCPGTNLVAT